MPIISTRKVILSPPGLILPEEQAASDRSATVCNVGISLESPKLYEQQREAAFLCRGGFGRADPRC